MPTTQLKNDIQKFNHYYRECPYDAIDFYRVMHLFEVTDPCLQHAIKKLMFAGKRGEKATAGWSANKDVEEAMVTLRRWQAMRAEELVQQVNEGEKCLTANQSSSEPSGLKTSLTAA